MRKQFVCLFVPLIVGTLHGPQFAVGDTIDPSASEELDLDLRSEAELAIERISPRSHDSSRTDSSTYIKLVRGDIGHIDSEALLNGDLQSLHDLLMEHSELTGAYPELDLELINISPDPYGQMVIYRQRINGIPVDVRNRIVIDANGHVSTLSSLIVDPRYASVDPQILEGEAITHAFDAIMAKIGRSIDDLAVTDVPSDHPKLLYGYVGDDVPLEPYWRISAGSKSIGISYSVRVYATTGKTVLSNNIED